MLIKNVKVFTEDKNLKTEQSSWRGQNQDSLHRSKHAGFRLGGNH